ncbi:unnamed protein product [Bursaphelenchus xylophilus]|uniref:(pine wood nematode) hypothetical protein n=1 Tax=Bursaphelenchus xylophilus TaxID=6326 RepID=A0A1I7RU97_BURXY|nr:unnamed protein product [Bursaphelenchus xylophilus]CAG9113959.1 unnamed protein product [Bursaphelenchus xylophilus]
MKTFCCALLYFLPIASCWKDDILKQKAAFMEAGMNETADPCQDFHAYANGRFNFTKLDMQYLEEAKQILSAKGDGNESTVLQKVKDHYNNCSKNPSLFFWRLEKALERSSQPEEIDDLVNEYLDKSFLTDDQKYLNLVQKAYQMLFKLPHEKYSDKDGNSLADARINLLESNVTDTEEFLFGIFGEQFDLSNITEVALVFPKGNQTHLRDVFLYQLTVALHKTVNIPEYKNCEHYILENFLVYYVKMLFDYLGEDYLDQSNKAYYEDAERLVEAAEVSLRFGNVLSDEMRTKMLGRLDRNKFFGINHPIYMDEEFYKYYDNLTLVNPIQSRWLNQWKPLIRAAKGKENMFYHLADVEFNAYHHPIPQFTIINIDPMRFPFYHPSFSPLMRLSGTGSVVGHELGHDFDSNLLELTELDSSYIEIFDCLYNFYNGQCNPERPERCIDPKHNIEENFADVFGIQMAYFAYKRDAAINGVGQRPRGNILDHLTDDQLFFLNVAQTLSMMPPWDKHRTPADPHSPGPTRIWGALSQFNAFANAFNCPVGSNYRQENGCKLYNTDIVADYNLTNIEI